MAAASIFLNRKLVIATMHGKEAVLAPILEKELGVQVVLPQQLDTDQFGTFSGERERHLSPLEAAIAKCKAAMQLTGCDLAVASEGSFGAHPLFGFLNSDEEIVVLVDAQYQLQVAAKELSTVTNFNGATIHSLQELEQFAKAAQFPSHALIIRATKTDTSGLRKGITNEEQLQQQAKQWLHERGSFYIETDMRAHFNPMRMQVIEAAARKLIDKLKLPCAACGMPGFDVVEVVPGLPCTYCGTATRSTKYFIKRCQCCAHESTEWYPHGKEGEDPMYCDTCNP